MSKEKHVWSNQANLLLAASVAAHGPKQWFVISRILRNHEWTKEYLGDALFFAPEKCEKQWEKISRFQKTTYSAEELVERYKKRRMTELRQAIKATDRNIQKWESEIIEAEEAARLKAMEEARRAASPPKLVTPPPVLTLPPNLPQVPKNVHLSPLDSDGTLQKPVLVQFTHPPLPSLAPTAQRVVEADKMEVEEPEKEIAPSTTAAPPVEPAPSKVEEKGEIKEEKEEEDVFEEETPKRGTRRTARKPTPKKRLVEDEPLETPKAAPKTRKRKRSEEEVEVSTVTKEVPEEAKEAQEKNESSQKEVKTEEKDEKSGLSDAMKTKMLKALSSLSKHGSAEFFLEPVTEDIAPGYFEVVKEPVCLQDVVALVQSNSISSLEELQEKLSKIRANAYLYNPEGNVVRSEADRFLKVADKYMEPLLIEEATRQAKREMLATGVSPPATKRRRVASSRVRNMEAESGEA